MQERERERGYLITSGPRVQSDVARRRPIRLRYSGARRKKKKKRRKKRREREKKL